MGAAVAMTRLDLTAGELRRAARKEKNSTVARRILALALVLEGSDRKKAAESCGMDRQTLRDWVHRYNAEGLAGLRSRQPMGPRSRLTTEQQAELAALVEAGPDPEQHGVVRWRRVDLRDELERRFVAHRGYVMVNGLITLAGTGGELLERPEIRAAYLEGGRRG
jgi:transposase